MPYLTVTVRVPRQVAVQCKDLARCLGWQLADFVRTTICLGATFSFLAADRPEAEEAVRVLLGDLGPLRLSRSFSLNIRERPYAYRIRGRKSALITVSVPRSISDEIALFANLFGASRNEAFNKSLQQGLMVYLKAQTSILNATSRFSNQGES